MQNKSDKEYVTFRETEKKREKKFVIWPSLIWRRRAVDWKIPFVVGGRQWLRLIRRRSVAELTRREQRLYV